MIDGRQAHSGELPPTAGQLIVHIPPAFLFIHLSTLLMFVTY
jgi:hypothetical protein